MVAKISSAIREFANDESGASLLEYTVLIALITVGVVGSVTSVGTWASTSWTTLKTNLKIN